jgi:DNA-directed RNA polymerase subunit K/omega
VIKRPDGMNAFEFAVLSGLRAAQLSRGCTPRVLRSAKLTVTAQHEIAERKVVRCPSLGESGPEPIEQHESPAPACSTSATVGPLEQLESVID